MASSKASLFLAWTAFLPSLYAAPLLQKRSESGPHITTDFPDPSILRVGSTWYAFAGQSLYDYKSTHIQFATSTDFETWTLQPGNDMLPDLPSWVDSSKNHIWAPDINHLVHTFLPSCSLHHLTRTRMTADSCCISAHLRMTPMLLIVLALHSVTLSTAHTRQMRPVLPALLIKEAPSMHLVSEMQMEPGTSYTRSMPTRSGTAGLATTESSRSCPHLSLSNKSRAME